MTKDRTSKVRVGVRVRPLASKEIQQGGKESLSVAPPSISIGQKSFTYDAVFDSKTDQDDLYERVAQSLLDSFVDGYNATILAYGQTGSGKTYTMGSEAHTQPEGSPQVGLIPRFISDFFAQMQRKKEASDTDDDEKPLLLDYNMKATFLEVYGEDVYDLLDSERNSLPLREDSGGGVVIAGLTSRAISNPSEALHVLHEGTNNRTTAATLMNLTSSRSHAVFTIHLSQVTRTGGNEKMDVISTSKFTFVDLAGSERMKKTGAEGERAREGIKINEGLLALGNVINALADDERASREKKIHVPYRQSKLTRLLQDALGGNSQTLFLACVSPSDTNVSETLSTLHYANRARNIRNAPTKNVDATSAELQRLHVLTSILQYELVKARFQKVSDGNENIGQVLDDAIMKRSDVAAYMQLVYRTANERVGADTPPTYAFSRIDSNGKLIGSTAFIRSGQKLESSVPAPTPAKAMSDRLDESFLIDVNPDEDMAILDHLLELQQHDHDYDKEKERDDEQLQEVDGELERGEALLLRLRDNLKAYQSLKTKYEELMAEVQQLESEKETLAHQLEKAGSTGCSVAIKRQLERVELNLTRARRETLSHRQKYREAEDQAKRCRVLERKITDLKQTKKNLIRKQKATETKYKEFSELKTKELLALRRKAKASETRVSKMRTEIQQQKNNIEKRKQYAVKLSEKLKQTESHLMKLLSMRKRDLDERASLLDGRRRHINAGNSKTESSNRAKDTIQALSNDDMKSVQFIEDKLVTERIEQTILRKQYEERVAAYSQTMQQVVAKVKILKNLSDLHEINPSEDVSAEKVEDTRESVAELELKLEVLGAELKNIESNLVNEAKQLRDEEAANKLLVKLPSLALRKLTLSLFTKIVETETNKRVIEDSLSRKDAALSSFEKEVELLNGQVHSLTKDLAERKVLLESGKDAFELLKERNEDKRRTEYKLASMESKMRQLGESLDEKEQCLKKQKLLLNVTMDKLVLSETSLAKLNGSIESKEVLDRLHEIWEGLGVDESTRETVRDEVQSCVSATCSRKLQEALELKLKTEESIQFLSERKAGMELALGIPNETIHESMCLLDQLSLLREQVKALEVPYHDASTRRGLIVNNAIDLSTSLCLPTEKLSDDLQTLLRQSEESGLSKQDSHPKRKMGRMKRASIMENVKAMVNSLSDDLEDRPNTPNPSIPFTTLLPKGSLEEDFLQRCEKDLALLRVSKSEKLVKDRETIQHISALMKDLCIPLPALFCLIENELKAEGKGLPAWWESDRAQRILHRVSSPKSQTEATDTRYLEIFHTTLERLAEGRRELSSVLRGIVEQAQVTLLDIVGREIDVSEAYASFHNALVQLPSLSQDFSDACISEMEALVLGVETMTQSEIEALTVVWEALKVSSDYRRTFWSKFDNQEELQGGDNKTPFDKLTPMTALNLENWMPALVSKGERINRELESKLAKLDAIHKEVERLRSKQDTKSQVLSLDAELRLLNVKLLDFEELQCGKQRLLTKKAGSVALLKEERFRKQMKAKFEAKLGQLATLLRSWEQEEGRPFNAALLSDDVRMLLDEPAKMEKWIETRTKLMPTRTVPAITPGNQLQQNSQEVASKRKTKLASGNSTLRKRPARHLSKTSKLMKKPVPFPSGSKSKLDRKRKAVEESENIENSAIQGSRSISPGRRHLNKSRRKESSTLVPFGRILSELGSPTPEQRDKR